MNKESVDCRRVKIPLAADAPVLPGDFAWDFDYPEGSIGRDRNAPIHHLYICLPGDGFMGAIAVQKGEPPPDRERVWGWDGNEDKPTLKPSILEPDRWHGYLRGGRLVSE